MAQSAGGHERAFLATHRTDAWWVPPLLTVIGLVAWGIYYFWAAWQASYYAVGPYLSPFYAPPLFVDPTQPGSLSVEHAFIGPWPAWWPSWLPPSPAFIIFVFPAMFRATCYYYRKAYYRSFFGMPPGCAVGANTGLGKYEGETGLLIFQNLHRYTLYFAILLLPFLFYEALIAFSYEGQLGVGLGGVLLLINAILLAGYTLGCHSFRHLIGGRLNCFSCDGVSEVQHGSWLRVTWLNQRHMLFAWASLGWIALTDLYIRLHAMGIIPDINTWNGVTWVIAPGGSWS